MEADHPTPPPDDGSGCDDARTSTAADASMRDVTARARIILGDIDTLLDESLEGDSRELTRGLLWWRRRSETALRIITEAQELDAPIA